MTMLPSVTAITRWSPISRSVQVRSMRGQSGGKRKSSTAVQPRSATAGIERNSGNSRPSRGAAQAQG
jgi:hypothetical protein